MTEARGTRPVREPPITGGPDDETRQPIEILLLGLFIALPLVRWNILLATPALPQYAILTVVAGLGMALLVYESWRSGRSLGSHRIWLLALLLVGWEGLSWLWSVDPYNTVIRTYQTASIVLVAYLVSQCVTPEFIDRLFAATAIGAGLVALIGLGQYFGYNPLDYRQSVVPASSFGNKNIAALYLDLATPIVFILVIRASNLKARWLWAIIFGLCLSFLLVSRTRGSWLGLMVGVVALIVVYWGRRQLAVGFWRIARKQRWPLLLAMAMPLLFLALPGSVLAPGYKTESLVEGKADLSVSTRFSAYINALQMIADHPLSGVGYGAFRQAYRKYAFSRAPTYVLTEDKQLARLHSDPLQQFVELGIPGGVLSLAIYLIAITTLWRRIRNGPQDEVHLLRLGLFLALIASGAHACVDFPLHRPISALLFWTWIGVAIALGRPSQVARPTLDGKRNLNRLGLATVACLGIVFSGTAVAFYRPYLEANYLTRHGVRAMIAHHCKEARRSTDKAWALFPYDYETRAYYLRIYAACRFNARDTLAVMDRVLAYDPTNIRALLTRGYLYLYFGDSRDAAFDFDEVVQLIPHRASGYIGLGRAAEQRGKPALARTFYKQAQQAQPGDPLAAEYLDRLQGQNSPLPKNNK